MPSWKSPGDGGLVAERLLHDGLKVRQRFDNVKVKVFVLRDVVLGSRFLELLLKSTKDSTIAEHVVGDECQCMASRFGACADHNLDLVEDTTDTFLMDG